jgi:hypothetical protein
MWERTPEEMLGTLWINSSVLTRIKKVFVTYEKFNQYATTSHHIRGDYINEVTAIELQVSVRVPSKFSPPPNPNLTVVVGLLIRDFPCSDCELQQMTDVHTICRAHFMNRWELMWVSNEHSDSIKC